MLAWAEGFAALTGWRRLALALLLGLISVLAMPPFGLWGVLALTLPGLVLLLDGAASQPLLVRRLREAAAIGWWFGFGYFMPGLYWIGSAFLVEAERFAWLMPFAITAMPAGLALFYALATALAVLLWQPGWPRLLALTAAFGAAEWLRATIFTGFPWNTLGYALTSQSSLAQLAALLGVHGLTLLTVATLSAPVLLLGSGRARWLGPLLALAVLVAAGGWGLWRVPAKPAPSHPDMILTLVQPNTPEIDKFRAEAQRGIFEQLLRMSSQPAGGERRRIVIWPETPVNALLLEEASALAAIGDTIGPGNLLITGTMRRGEVAGRTRIFNSLAVVDGAGTPLAIYDKSHLVPFGEYLPFQETLEALGLESLTRMRGGFAVGPGNRTLTVAGVPPFSPLICYEVIFPATVVDPQARPAWLLNVTNDAWFGVSSGPFQHVHKARMRAIEQGLPLVRVAGTGISAVFDPYGRETATIPLLHEAVMSADLPMALGPTPYARFGDGIFAVLITVVLMLLWSAHALRLAPQA